LVSRDAVLSHFGLRDAAAHLPRALRVGCLPAPGSGRARADRYADGRAEDDRRLLGRRAIDRDVRLFFTLTNAGLDASICCWDNKRAFASVRPITAIRYLFEGQRLPTWGGPSGVQWIDGKHWRPYQPSTFPTPPFPEFSSGHSTFSAAAAQVLMLFTGSDRFGASVSFPAGSSRMEPGIVPAREMTLRWDTFSQAADQAGLSRRYGGIHFARLLRGAGTELSAPGPRTGRVALLSLQDLATVVPATVVADGVRKDRVAAVRALVQPHRGQLPVAAATTIAPALGVLSLGYLPAL
jgi:hypothetical protein